MPKRFAATVMLTAAVILLANCGQTEPSPTPPRPSATPLPTEARQAGAIAFVSERDGNMEIYVMGADGGNQTRLTNNPARDFAPAWSPDGARIAFASGRDGNDELYVMAADGSGARRLADDPADDGFSSWSPDGSHIVFDSVRDGDWEIYTLDATGGNLRQLTNNSVDDGLPVWSPDGSRIVFESMRDGDYEIYKMDADGANQQRLTDNETSDGFPSWSPDGARIAFTSQRDGNAEIYLMNADGSHPLRLTNHNAEDTSPSWSPDGTQIAFSSSRDGNQEIYVMNADGSNVRRLTDNPADDYGPAWKPEPAGAGQPPASAGALQQSTQTFPNTPTFQVELGDLDGDGDLDAVFAHPDLASSQVWWNDGHGHFSDSGQALTPQGHGVGVGDLDRDGDLDLFITCDTFGDSTRRSQVYLNNGAGLFTAVGQGLADSALSGNSAVLADVDGDGDLDGIVEYYQDPYRVHWNDGHGLFENSSTLPVADDAMLAWGDLNGDGHVDIFSKEPGVGYRTLLNDGAGQFSEHWQTAEAEAILRGGMALGDLDGDGDLDAVVANGFQSTSHPTRVWVNDGTGRFADSGQTLGLTVSAWLGLGDLNGDGYPDIYVSNFGRPNEVWYNDGKGAFADSGLRLGGDGLTRIGALGDLDNDGDLDIFVATFGDGSNEVWLNQQR